VGLGNPGERYETTRHNAGFRVVERLAAQEGIRIRSRESGSRVGRGRIGETPILLALPQTYMNASGEAVGALCQNNGIEIGDLCVVYDEIELALGVLRFRPGGSSAGHNGMRSIIGRLGTSDFPRLRVGVRGDRYSKEHDLGDYVLEPFARSEREAFDESVERAAEALRVWVRDGIDSAMRFANPKPSSPDGASRPD
jgi:PTH1 family peptidyl-tRNA hydrolase